MPPANAISLRGCRENNLKNLDINFPHGKLIAVCGVSGSGKTSLVLDTLYAEGQRRYVESFSTYARQYLDRFDKPDFDSIDGLPPALAVRGGENRRNTNRSSRATVGSASETLDYLRLLFSKTAELFCHSCGTAVRRHSPQTVSELIRDLEGSKIMLAYEVAWEDVKQRAITLAELQRDGFMRLVCNGSELRLTDSREELAKVIPKSGSAFVIVDRIRGGESASASESIELAFELGLGEIVLLIQQPSADDTPNCLTGLASPYPFAEQAWLQVRLSDALRCSPCNLDYSAPEPRLFSYNSPLGACDRCQGFGDTIDVDMDLVIPDRTKTLRQGAIAPWTTPSYGTFLDELIDIAQLIDIPLDTPIEHFSARQLRTLQTGDTPTGFPGLDGFFAYLERKKYKMHVRVFLSRWRSYNRCADCNGNRLCSASLAYKLGGKNFADLCSLPVSELYLFLRELALEKDLQTNASVPLESTLLRLQFLTEVGLDYITLNRSLRTLSGGEAQRTGLAAVLGSSLVNMLYVLDEPSAGLHADDVVRLLAATQALAARGNTVAMIEHDDLLIQHSDWVIELGPGAGHAGGEVVYQGRFSDAKRKQSLTADYIRGFQKITNKSMRRKASNWLTLTGCKRNNLQNIDVVFPLGVLCCVTGVSGSGKSTLVHDTLHPAVTSAIAGRAKSKTLASEYESLSRIVGFEQCVLVDQQPISRSPRSNPVTFIKAFDEIRRLFADSLEAKTRNLSAGHFSFNSPLGRCEQCGGDGSLQIDMQFLADIQMTCPGCAGSRYKPEVLQARYRGQTIADVLKMPIDDAITFFRGAAKIQNSLRVLQDVGLGYLQLGQSAMTLSSGEAQRLKLATHLSTDGRKKTLFLLDEPSTGLHLADLRSLMNCFEKLLDDGHSLILVEHNMHVIAAADYIIDLGPGPAWRGGKVVATGTPEEVAANPNSATGRHLHF